MSTTHEILHNIIFNFLNFYDQHTFGRINKHNTMIHITNMHDTDLKYLKRLDDKILQNYDFIVKLDARRNPNVTNVNHMKKIKVLDATFCCGIDDGTKIINLEELHASRNAKITNVNHMTKLKELDVSFDYEINDNRIKHINLEKLYASNNQKFKFRGCVCI